MKKTTSFSVSNLNEFKIQMLNWASRFNIFCLLDNQQYHFDTPAFECLLAVGCKQKISLNSGNALGALKEFCANQNDWLFGHIGYDIKNEIEQLSSENFDGVAFSDAFFFVPEIILQLSEHQVTVFFDEGSAEEIIEAIKLSASTINDLPAKTAIINSRFTQQEYIDAVKKIQQHILRGDCYELNFCQEFFADNIMIDPLSVYHHLVKFSPNPFSALYKLEDKYCICASPERYLKRSGNQIISQPIKGTAKRDLQHVEVDEANKLHLINSAKEKSENVMVVDLVRNDLSKICVENSVQVDELFGIYSFPQVHQMISTVSGKVTADTDWIDIVKATFPMGSMTGAPKKKVMQLIEEFEKTKRGLFSGAVGYIKPDGDFDFNVVIRSILYNASTNYLSFQVGSAITFYSEAEKEYEECLLKVEAIVKVLG
ncbi:anthranilate synthase component I family protein [Ferruginibacter lapsinanis]|uniref:anthranilate synthase component I family protein n=1 Tax=Ferruginibacter lapsinanis TaxID=563172 RepID=UPI001E42DF8D|nr:chorismate-binding protein [Ferruginibacter lapsinanis]UEG50378.1 anthranilate synthase component I family protein [Ferruginibacter lapsinanis]